MNLKDKNYDPNKFINFLAEKLCAKNDAALCKEFDIKPEEISAMRHRRRVIGPIMLLRAHEKLNMPTKELRKMMRVE